MRAKPLLFTVLGLGAVAVLAGCNEVSTLGRPNDPVVLTGLQAPSLLGAPTDEVVAFRHTIVDDEPAWTQIPVQVDERVVVPFGTQPPNNTVPGTVGTVYGYGSGGPSALQYADPGTWVGPDPNPALDGDDEIVVMGFDAGGQAPSDRPDPPGVVSGSGVSVEVGDPRSDGDRGWVYLFRSGGGLDPAAGQDYVDYDFELTSGDYATTYRRADGPNPETSTATTATYEIGFTDRWKETSWRLLDGGATGVDILDANKNRFSLTTCGRSNETFADAEGAFVANIDGPVRAIRSYVGANSGPLTQRTHLMYRDREEVVTDLRVHSIVGVMDFLDLSTAATGMTYRSATVRDGVTVDGAPDPVGTTRSRWEAIDGPQGRIYTTVAVNSSVAGLDDRTYLFYRDQADPPEAECWGDGSFIGAHGVDVTGGIPNTDPRTVPTASLQMRRINRFLPPAPDPSKVAAYADDWARDQAEPLTLKVTRFPS